MHILIIEDEPLVAKQLKKHIKAYDADYTIVATLGSVADVLNFLNHQKQPDLIFSDIELNDGLCFDIFAQMPIKCPIIFCTAYNNYWQAAFRTNSIDYLLKPVRQEAVFKSLDKYQDINTFYESEEHKKFHQILEQYQPQNKYKSRFLIKIGNKYELIPTAEIICAYSEDKASFIVRKDKKTLPTYDSLDKIELELSSTHFFRLNRHFIVHINAIASIESHIKSKLLVHIIDDIFEPQVVSQSKTAAFKTWLEQ
ncbi:MAG: LytR/AlgR family response regulator transcription factor [Salibacteraceae bacterium]